MPPRTRFSRRKSRRVEDEVTPADVEEGTGGRSRQAEAAPVEAAPVEAAAVEAEDSEQTQSNSVPANSEESIPETTVTKPMLPAKMYFNPSQYGKKIKLSSRCYVKDAVNTLRTGLKYKLKEHELDWFLEHPQFSHFFHLPKANNHKLNGIWLLFLRTACTEKKREAWFVVNGVPIRYGIREHALISGLSCRSYPEQDLERVGSMRFADRVFGEKAIVKYPDVLAKLKQMKPSEDRLKMAVLYFLCSVIIGQAKTGVKATPVEPFFLRAVNDLELCKTFPWGRLSFENNLEEIQHTVDHFEGEVRGTNWVYPSFCLPLEYLAFEAIPALRKKFVEDVPNARKTCPRMCRMKFKKGQGLKGFSLAELNDGLGETREIDSILVPYVEEAALLSRLTEKDEDEDVEDPVVRSWMKCLFEDDIQFCLDDMYAEDVAAGKEKEEAEEETGNVAAEETSNVAAEETAGEEIEEKATKSDLAAVTEQMKEALQDLSNNIQKDFKIMKSKVDGLDDRLQLVTKKVVVMEGYMKQLQGEKAYEDWEYVSSFYIPAEKGKEGAEELSKEKGKDAAEEQNQKEKETGTEVAEEEVEQNQKEKETGTEVAEEEVEQNQKEKETGTEVAAEEPVEQDLEFNSSLYAEHGGGGETEEETQGEEAVEKNAQLYQDKEKEQGKKAQEEGERNENEKQEPGEEEESGSRTKRLRSRKASEPRRYEGKSKDNEDEGEHEKDEAGDEGAEDLRKEQSKEAAQNVEEDLLQDVELYRGFVSSLFDDPEDVEDVVKEAQEKNVVKEAQEENVLKRKSTEPPRYGLRTRKPLQHLGPAKKRKT